MATRREMFETVVIGVLGLSAAGAGLVYYEKGATERRGKLDKVALKLVEDRFSSLGLDRDNIQLVDLNTIKGFVENGGQDSKFIAFKRSSDTDDKISVLFVWQTRDENGNNKPIATEIPLERVNFAISNEVRSPSVAFQLDPRQFVLPFGERKFDSLNPNDYINYSPVVTISMSDRDFSKSRSG